MRTSDRRIQRKFTDLRLRTKILFLILFVGGMTTFTSFVGFTIIQNANNKRLYRTMAGALNSGATIISDELMEIEALSNTIISNKYLRKGLVSIADGEISEIHLENVDNTVSSILTEYHNNHPEINYIMLKNDYMTSSSYRPGSKLTEPSTISGIQSAVKKASGYPIWVTDYSEKEGIFLGRNCLRIRNLKQEVLGTLIVNVNVGKLVKLSDASAMPDFDMRYIIHDGGNQVYHSSALTGEEITGVSDQSGQDAYRIITVGEEKYFSVQNTIEGVGWDFICAIPYTGIVNSLRVSGLLSVGIILIVFLIAIYIAIRVVTSITSDFSELIYKMNEFGRDESRLPVSRTDYSGRKDEAAVLHNRFDGMTVQIQQLIRQNYLNDIANKEAQLQSLQAQVNPHFLYNVLDCIYWRAKVTGDEQIFRMVESLGDLLRASLSKKKLITLREERKIVGSYMTIQKIRFDKERLEYQEDIPDGLNDVMIPQMTIQPLVDNAVNYAMEMITETCLIRVWTAEEKGVLHIFVENNGSQFEENLMEKLREGMVVAKGIGIGLLNIDQRIKLICGNQYGLILSNPDDEHALAEILIPERRNE